MTVQRGFKPVLGLIFLGALCATDSALAQRWKPKVENRFHLEPAYYFEDVGRDTSQVTATLNYELKLAFRPTRSLRIRFSPWFYSDPASRSPSETFIADISEATADYRRGDWNLKVGVNQFAWGMTDVVNPLDVVSARRYIDLLNVQKRGTPSVDLIWERDEWRLEGVYIPIQLESIMPGEKSRWLPRDMTYTRTEGLNKIFLADRFSYSYTDRKEIDDALKNNFGFRGDYRGSGLDLTAVFFQGAPTAPAIFTPVVSGDGLSSTPDGTVVGANHITLQAQYYLRRTAGAGAVVTLSDWIVRLAYANSDRLSNVSTTPGWSQTFVAGIERSFAAPAGSTLTVLLQTSHAKHELQADNFITSLDRSFDQAWMLGLRLSTSTDWTFSAAGLYDVAHSGGYGQLRIERRLTDGLTGALSGDWLDGDPGSPLGTYRRNKRVALSATAYF